MRSIYMHRYTPSTVSTVLNEYLREFQAKLESSLQQQERLAERWRRRVSKRRQKEGDRLRKVLLELDEYEHDVLYPLASQQIAIDLDDGVKVNYPKLGAALEEDPGVGGERMSEVPSGPPPPGAPLRTTSAWCSGTTRKASTPSDLGSLDLPGVDDSPRR